MGPLDHLNRLLRGHLKQTAPSGRQRHEVEGLYFTYQPEDAKKFTAMAQEAFPYLKREIRCFGYTWLGDQLATSLQPPSPTSAQTLLLETGTGEVLELPVDPTAFSDDKVIENEDAMLAPQFFAEWRRSGGAVPRYGQSIGYKIPLYLSGKDEVSNLQMTDLDVYLTVSYQVLARISDLPEGTRVDTVSISNT